MFCTNGMFSRRVYRLSSVLLFVAVFSVQCAAVSMADVPIPIQADPRTVGARTVIDGHVVTFDALTPIEARRLPANIIRASIDGRPARWYAVGRIVNLPKRHNAELPDGTMVAVDPSQANGNFPGVVSVLPAADGNLVVTGTASMPVIDLGQSITLGGASAIKLSSTSGATIMSSGTGAGNNGLTFDTTGQPGGDAYLFKVNSAPSGNVLNVLSDIGMSLLAVGKTETVIKAGGNASIPLVVQGFSGMQSNSIAQFYQSAGGAEILDIEPTGTTTIQTATNVVGFIIDGASGGQSVDLMRAFTKSGGTQIFALTPAGGLEIAPTINSTNTLSYVPPVYGNSSNVVGSTLHVVSGTHTLTVSPACSTNTTCTISGSETLTGTSVFANNTTVGCAANARNGDGSGPPIVQASVNSLGTTVNFVLINMSGSTIANNSTFPVQYFCLGA